MSDSGDFESRYAELREGYVVRVRERIERLEGLAGELEEGGGAEVVEEIYQVVHRLSGSGETMGFPEVSELSIEVEEELEVGEPGDDLPRRLRGYCDALRACLGD